MVQITQNNFIANDETKIKPWQKEFEQEHCIVIPNLLDKKWVGKIMDSLEKAEFFENEHLTDDNIVFANDQTIKGNNMALHQINFLLNNSSLFRTIEMITKSKGIQGFSGRIYRNMPEKEHHLDWHDDTEDKNRIIAISINLSRNKFAGGLFQIRDKATKKIFREVSCGNPGDAHIFRVSPQLQHRVLPTTGEFPRMAAAGWFINKPVSFFKKIDVKN
jgi:2OG-Fe(II) oxygenase superfamily